ncbi:hypothetical protein KI387_029398, partial [Taxus chinensis]
MNVWAMGRDPTISKNPLEFIPHRFWEGENGKIEYKGQNIDIIPFRTRKRLCVGFRMVICAWGFIAPLIPVDTSTKDEAQGMDMGEEFGLTLNKDIELNTIPMPRLFHNVYYPSPHVSIVAPTTALATTGYI